MKILSIIITLCALSAGLTTQDRNNLVYSKSEIVLETSTGQVHGTMDESNKILDSLKAGLNEEIVSFIRAIK